MARLLRHRALLSIALAFLAGCADTGAKRPDLNALYSRSAQTIGDERHPAIVIPGILGSKLKDPASDRFVWGAFVHGAADPDFEDDARLFSLPMREGVPLRELRDDVTQAGVLDTLTIDVGVLPVELEAYLGIMKTLGVGQYRDAQILGAGYDPSRVDYAGKHFTCDQFGYDWRRDISENAAALDELIRRTLEGARAAARANGQPGPDQVDVLAHSMGGMVLRYYLMHGTQPLPDDGSLPAITWAGARHVRRAILIGTPSAGSVLALRQLVEGVSYSPITPTYRPAIVGTLPAVYQLLPRPRHARVVSGDGAAFDLYDAATWERLRWGLLDPRQERWVAALLPEVKDPAERRRIARDHLAKCLARARQLHEAIDRASPTPPGLSLVLFAGDAEATASVIVVDERTGALRVAEKAAGDGTVTRASALLDEREGGEWTARLRTPIDWSGVTFLTTDHIGLTSDAAFSDNVLHLLLESDR